VLGRPEAEHLLEHGWITSSQVEEARRTQGFFGGRLETHLLKLGYVNETVLGEALTEVSGVPFASWERLRAARRRRSKRYLPLVLEERTVVLLYLDGDDAPLRQPDIPLMRRVAANAELAFETLHLRNKLRES
jgi:hypothetical protein